MTRLGLSNIAFEQLPGGHELVRHQRITSIELAPTTLCPWEQFTFQVVKDYETKHKVKVFSLQSVFYGTDIVMAKDPITATKHLKHVLGVCKSAGIDKITFGSPKARVCKDDNERRLVERVIRDCALIYPEVTICVEPNARIYGCNYMTTLADAIAFAEDIQLPNVKIQLDVGNFILEGDNLDTLSKNVYMIGAVHISDVNLGPLIHDAQHQLVARFLSKIGYNGHISLEMRMPEDPKALITALSHSNLWYAASLNHKLPSCLVGYTGFVGSNLRDQLWFNQYVNRSNLHTIKNEDFDTVYFAAMPGSMWYANGHAEEDFDSLQLYWNVLETVQATKFVLISSMNVYGGSRDVYETDAPQPCTTYGRHRLVLEQLVRAHFARYFIVRLPGLFGPHLKKNAIYDIANGHRLEFVNLATCYQWYDLTWLAEDMERVWGNLSKDRVVLNVTTPPVTTREIATLSSKDTSVCRDEPSTFNPLIQSHTKYLHTLDQVLERIQSYFAETL
jgi:sugar phosphate isomerase/epimerase/dTDP-4-dehydrorhamnose reductase